MIRLEHVDLTNPGQFFACCGLFELAHRLDAGAMAHFDSGAFVVSAKLTIERLVQSLQQAGLEDLDPADATASPLCLGAPFELRLDWWKDKAAGGATLKPWAGGTMHGGRIARAMRASLSESLASGALLDHGMVVFERDGKLVKKVEPYYFDARRAASALPLDVGFSTDPLGFKTLAFPATEFLSLVGLQRFRPVALDKRSRVFVYSSWLRPLPIELAALAVAGQPVAQLSSYRFENAFRTDKRMQKSFLPAVPLTGEDHG